MRILPGRFTRRKGEFLNFNRFITDKHANFRVTMENLVEEVILESKENEAWSEREEKRESKEILDFQVCTIVQ